MTSRRASEGAGSVLSFTFLDVLMCTMGSLLLLLVVFGVIAKKARTRREGETAMISLAALTAPTQTPAGGAAADEQASTAAAAVDPAVIAAQLDPASRRTSSHRTATRRGGRSPPPGAGPHCSPRRARAPAGARAGPVARNAPSAGQRRAETDRRPGPGRRRSCAPEAIGHRDRGPPGRDAKDGLDPEVVRHRALQGRQRHLPPAGLRRVHGGGGHDSARGHSVDRRRISTARCAAATRLAAAIRAAHEELNARAVAAGHTDMPDPYPLLIVRPDGADAYAVGPRRDSLVGFRLRLRVCRGGLEAEVSRTRPAPGAGDGPRGR